MSSLTILTSLSSVARWRAVFFWPKERQEVVRSAPARAGRAAANADAADAGVGPPTAAAERRHRRVGAARVAARGAARARGRSAAAGPREEAAAAEAAAAARGAAAPHPGHPAGADTGSSRSCISG